MEVKRRFTIEYCGGPSAWPPQRIEDFYLDGFFIFKFFVGWVW